MVARVGGATYVGVYPSLLNCSCEDDFDSEIAFLRAELSKRGYPSSCMPEVKYSVADRQIFIRKLDARDVSRPAHASPKNVLVLSTEFSRQIQQLRLRTRIDELLDKLRNRIGNEFFTNGTAIIAYPSANTIFQRTYRMSFLLGESSMGGRGTGSVCA